MQTRTSQQKIAMYFTMLVQTIQRREVDGSRPTLAMRMCLGARMQRKRALFYAWHSLYMKRVLTHLTVTGHIEAVIATVLDGLLVDHDSDEQSET